MPNTPKVTPLTADVQMTNDAVFCLIDGQIEDLYTMGWKDADLAIRACLPGHRTCSQGDTEWDRGWNARVNLLTLN